jgi:acyl-coenzyme A thioesterase PaaI-like protein
MGAAVHSTLPQGSGYATLEVKFNLVRGITADTGRVLAVGRLIHGGKTVATVEATLREAGSGTLLAHGTSTCLVR